jgi:hypothetical protein
VDQQEEKIYQTDEEWIKAAQAAVEKFIKDGSKAMDPGLLTNLKLGLQGFAVAAKRRPDLAESAKDTLIIVRAILSGLGGSVEH